MGVGVGIAVAVEVGSSVGVGTAVNVWVGGTVGDEGSAAELVPAQADRMMDIIHAIPINFVLIMDYFLLSIFFAETVTSLFNTLISTSASFLIYRQPFPVEYLPNLPSSSSCSSPPMI